MQDDKAKPQTTDLVARAKVVAAVLSEFGLHVSTPDDGDLDDVERERWNACLEVVRRLRECAQRKNTQSNTTVPVPISAAEKIAKLYGYHQVVVIARSVGEDGIEHVTTYGVDKPNCDTSARIGNFLKHKIMGWPVTPASDQEVLAGDICQWVDHELAAGEWVPDFWDELDTSERLAEYLAAIGYRKVQQ